MNNEIFLQILRPGICPDCKKHMDLTLDKNGIDLIWKCKNQNCKSRGKARPMPYHVYKMLSYLEDNQPT